MSSGHTAGAVQSRTINDGDGPSCRPELQAPAHSHTATSIPVPCSAAVLRAAAGRVLASNTTIVTADAVHHTIDWRPRDEESGHTGVVTRIRGGRYLRGAVSAHQEAAHAAPGAGPQPQREDGLATHGAPRPRQDSGAARPSLQQPLLTPYSDQALMGIWRNFTTFNT